MFEVDYSKVPSSHMVEGVRMWIEEGKIGEGSFLWMVVTNDLRGAIAKADDINIRLLKEWVQFFHWEVPSSCHGDVVKATKWMNDKQVERQWAEKS